MVRPRVEAALSALFGVLTVITVVWPDWIEAITGLDPDGGSGETEWGFVVVLGVVTLALALLARRHHRLAST
jgi:hypothetical protein